MKTKLPVALSNRHAHLSSEHIDILFGENHCLKEMKDLSQPGQYACEEKIDLEGGKGTIKGIRVLGPARKDTQIELSLADARKLGIVAPIRDSGDIEGSPGAKIVGPNGSVEIDRGIIIAARHIHFSDRDAIEFGVKDGDLVRVKTFGERAVIFENVLARVSPSYALEMHIDLEEGNAAGVQNGDMVEIIK